MEEVEILEERKKEKRVETNEAFLPLMEAFYSIQGEGYNSGKPAYFIRLAGCEVGCHWCDVKESWDVSAHPLVNIDNIVNDACIPTAKTVVITGGEPLFHNLDAITQKLKKRGIKIFLETSGAYKLTGTWDWICLSPKKTKPPLKEIYSKVHELKVVIFNKSDFQWAEQHAQLVSSSCKLFLQPEWSKAEKITPLVVDYVKHHPQWNISLQIHKYMNIP